MNPKSKRDKGISLIENYSLAHNDEMLTITFHEGDCYRCLCDDGSWEDNGSGTPGRTRGTFLGSRSGTSSPFTWRKSLRQAPTKTLAMNGYSSRASICRAR